MMVSTPAFEWKWNINTLAILFGFAGALLGGGYVVNELVQGRISNARNIERLDQRIDGMMSELRAIPNHELRLTTVERELTEGAMKLDEVNEVANELKVDIRVIKEIVQRIENSQRSSLDDQEVKRTRFP